MGAFGGNSFRFVVVQIIAACCPRPRTYSQIVLFLNFPKGFVFKSLMCTPIYFYLKWELFEDDLAMSRNILGFHNLGGRDHATDI